MKREDLFLAIGAVEEERLQRSEWSLQEPSLTVMEEPDMKKSVNKKRIVRNLLVAAIAVCTLAISAFAATAYLLFGSPEDMLGAIFGDKTGYDHSEGSIRPDPEGPPSGIIVEPTYDRVPADETVVAEDVAPLVEPVGQSISWEGYTLTIDANLYDSSTKCGLVTYVLENPDGLGYSLQSDGEVWFSTGEVVSFSQFGRSYIIGEKSTDTKLAAAYYYQLRNPNSSDLEIGFTQWASITQDEINQKVAEIKEELRREIPEDEIYEFQKLYYGEDWLWFEENRTREEIIDAGYEVKAYERLDEVTTCPDKITIPESAQSEMTSISLGGGVVVLSPIAVTIHEKEIENIGHSFMGLMKVRFDDGTEYVVQDGYISNYVFNVSDSEGMAHTYMFNRIIDVRKVVSVIVDGDVELTVD